MLMPANWEGLLLVLLLLPPGALYYFARARVLKREDMESPTDDGRLEVLVRMMFLGIVLELVSAMIVALSVWVLLRFMVPQNWLASLQFETSLPDPEPLLDESWDSFQAYVSGYTESHWVLVGIAAGAAYLLALLLGLFMGTARTQRTIDQEEIQREADEVSNARYQDDANNSSNDRSQVMIRLRNGTVYSGNLSGRPRRRPVLGKKELVLTAPIRVRAKGIDKKLPSESLAVATSEIASLSLVNGNQNRLYLYSDTVPPPWLPSDTR
jgi:Family of unknown function (DUF6338)